MHETKFRAWVKDRKIMADVLTINYKDLTVQLPIETDVIEDYWWDETSWLFDEIDLMQYTGLKDPHGNIVCEGDVVQWDDGEYSFRGIVVKDAWQFYIRGIDPQDNFDFADYSDGDKTDLRVIGNMYEHSHLLKEEVYTYE